MEYEASMPGSHDTAETHSNVHFIREDVRKGTKMKYWLFLTSPPRCRVLPPRQKTLHILASAPASGGLAGRGCCPEITLSENFQRSSTRQTSTSTSEPCCQSPFRYLTSGSWKQFRDLTLTTSAAVGTAGLELYERGLVISLTATTNLESLTAFSARPRRTGICKRCLNMTMTI